MSKKNKQHTWQSDWYNKIGMEVHTPEKLAITEFISPTSDIEESKPAKWWEGPVEFIKWLAIETARLILFVVIACLIVSIGVWLISQVHFSDGKNIFQK